VAGGKCSGKKSTNAEIDRRVRLAAEKITEGHDVNWIRQHLSELTGCSERNASRYIDRARKMIQARWEEVDRKEMASTILSKLDLIYQRALEHRQYSACQAAVASQAKITGVDAPKGG
jgi:hypothetical protein